jgi:hypothetical protein
LPVPDTAAEHWLFWLGEMLDGLQDTLTDVMVDDCDELLAGAKVAPVHPVIHTMPEKRRQKAAIRRMVDPPYSFRKSCDISTFLSSK